MQVPCSPTLMQLWRGVQRVALSKRMRRCSAGTPPVGQRIVGLGDSFAVGELLAAQLGATTKKGAMRASAGQGQLGRGRRLTAKVSGGTIQQMPYGLGCKEGTCVHARPPS